MAFMFYGATSFNHDISGWVVSSVNRMQFMFYGATSFNQDLSSWDVSNVFVCYRFSDSTPNWTEPKPNLTCPQ